MIDHFLETNFDFRHAKGELSKGHRSRGLRGAGIGTWAWGSRDSWGESKEAATARAQRTWMKLSKLRRAPRDRNRIGEGESWVRALQHTYSQWVRGTKAVREEPAVGTAGRE